MSAAGAGGPSAVRRGKRGKKGTTTKQLEQIPPSSYTDAEEALEAGVQLEEKAERFAVGDKAEKYFRLSLDVYRRALHLRSNDADAAYNAARVLYVLATNFYVPQASLTTLQEAITTYQYALTLSSPTSTFDELPNAFYLDVRFNLGVAQVALAEQIERVGVAAAEQVQSVVQEAIGNFEDVLRGQKAVLRQQLEQESENSSAEIERAPLLASADGDVDENEERQSNEGASEEGEVGESVRSEYTSSLITPASALETVANLHSAVITLLNACDDPDQAEAAIRAASHYLGQAESIHAAFPDGERRSPDDDWNEQVASLHYATLELKITSLTKDTFRAVRQESLTSAMDEAVQEAASLLARTDVNFDLATTKGRSLQKIHIQHLEQLGDLLFSLSRLSLGFIYAHGKAASGDQVWLMTIVQASWQLCTQSSKLLLAALKALDTSSPGQVASVVLGITHTSNPSMRRRCALYTSLSALSILRSDATFVSGAIATVNQTTRQTLLDNGRVYARKALAEVGLGWLLQTPPSGVPPAYSLPHGGLDSLAIDAEAVLALLRALAVRSAVLEGPESESARREASVLGGNLSLSMLSSTGEVAETWKACLGLRSGLALPQGHRMLEEVIGEEGEGTVTPEERAFWVELENALTNS